MLPSRLFAATLTLVAAGLAASCEDIASSTNPTRTLGAPQVTSLTPATLVRLPTPQRVKVVGSSFREGVLVELTTPAGERTEIRGTAIQNFQPSAFEVDVLVTTVGAHQFVVRNPDNRTSSPVALEVTENPTAAPPVITNAVPASVPLLQALQTISLIGMNFDIGAEVQVTDPAGITTRLPVSAVTRIDATTLSVTMAFDQAGQYIFVVINPNGAQSGSISIPVS